MNILIVDDDLDKTADIASAISEELEGITNLLIYTASCLSDARNQLRKHKYDILVLDMKISQSDGGEARLEAGIDFIAELHKGSYFPVPPYSIVVTAFDEAMVNSSTDGTEGIYAWIKYDPLDDRWKRALRARVRYLSRVLERKTEETGQFDYDLAVVCALEDIELSAVLDLPWNWSEPSRPDEADPTSYFIGTLDTTLGKRIRVVAAAAPQMGMAAMSVLCMKMINRFRPKYIATPGIAAGVKKEKGVNFGDILVAELSWDYGSGKVRLEEGKTVLSPDPRPIYLEPMLKTLFGEIKRDTEFLKRVKQQAQNMKPKADLKLHIGPIASGAAVVADENIIADLLKQNRKLMGIEMEIYGMFYAAVNCPSPRPKAFALKSICDYGDREKSDTYQPYAAYTSAMVLDHMVRSKLRF